MDKQTVTVGKYVTSNACSSGKGELPNGIPISLEESPSRTLCVYLTFSPNLCTQ